MKKWKKQRKEKNLKKTKDFGKNENCLEKK